MAKERVRRSDPSRTDPIRDWDRLFRNAETNNTAKKGSKAGDSDDPANGTNGHRWDEAISDAVKLGYQIIDDQISQGKRVAEEISERAYTSNSVGGDVSEIVRRLLQLYTDIGASCFELIDSLTRNVDFTENVRHWVDNGLAQTVDETTYTGGGHRNIPIDVCSNHSTRVSLNLDCAANNCHLGVHGLFPLNRTNPPLHAVEFHYDKAGQQPTLKIRIPQSQPEDTYTGAIVDLETNQPRGTLSINLHAEVPDSKSIPDSQSTE